MYGAEAYVHRKSPEVCFLDTCLLHIVSIAAKCSAVEVGRISSCYHVYRETTSCQKIEGVILGT
jgi:hypothetical protein